MIKINGKTIRDLEEQVIANTYRLNFVPEGLSGHNFKGVMPADNLEAGEYSLWQVGNNYHLWYNNRGQVIDLGQYPAEGLELSTDEADKRYLGPDQPLSGIVYIEPQAGGLQGVKINPVSFTAFDWTASLILDINEVEMQELVGFTIINGDKFQNIRIESERIIIYDSVTGRDTTWDTTFVSGWCILTIGQDMRNNALRWTLTHQLGTHTGMYNVRHYGPMDVYAVVTNEAVTRVSAAEFSISNKRTAVLGDFGTPADVLFQNIPEATRLECNAWIKDGSLDEAYIYDMIRTIFATTSPRKLILSVNQYNDTIAKRVSENAFAMCLENQCKLYVVPAVSQTNTITYLQSIGCLFPTNIPNISYAAKGKAAVLSTLI